MVIEEEREKGGNLFDVEVLEGAESGERVEHSVAEERGGGSGSGGGGGSCSHLLFASCTLVEDGNFWGVNREQPEKKK